MLYKDKNGKVYELLKVIPGHWDDGATGYLMRRHNSNYQSFNIRPEEFAATYTQVPEVYSKTAKEVGDELYHKFQQELDAAILSQDDKGKWDIIKAAIEFNVLLQMNKIVVTEEGFKYKT